MRVQQCCKEGGRPAGKPGRLFEGMLRGDDHEQKQIASTHALQAPTDGDVTWNPWGQVASGHGASPQYEASERGGGDDATGKRSRCPYLYGKEVICGIRKRASL